MIILLLTFVFRIALDFHLMHSEKHLLPFLYEEQHNAFVFLPLRFQFLVGSLDFCFAFRYFLVQILDLKL